MHDPACSKFCEELEDRGFKFSGVMAGFHDRENIIYYKSASADISEIELLSARARLLYEYGQHNDLNKLIANLAQADAVSHVLVHNNYAITKS